MESKLFCFFYRWCALGDTEAVHSKPRKAVLEARGFKPIFPINFEGKFTDLYEDVSF
jgi:hypothetical protein